MICQFVIGEWNRPTQSWLLPVALTKPATHTQRIPPSAVLMQFELAPHKALSHPNGSENTTRTRDSVDTRPAGNATLRIGIERYHVRVHEAEDANERHKMFQGLRVWRDSEF